MNHINNQHKVDHSMLVGQHTDNRKWFTMPGLGTDPHKMVCGMLSNQCAQEKWFISVLNEATFIQKVVCDAIEMCVCVILLILQLKWLRTSH